MMEEEILPKTCKLCQRSLIDEMRSNVREDLCKLCDPDYSSSLEDYERGDVK